MLITAAAGTFEAKTPHEIYIPFHNSPVSLAEKLLGLSGYRTRDYMAIIMEEMTAEWKGIGYNRFLRDIYLSSYPM